MTLTPDDLPSFGTLLKGFRKRRRLTQQQLAETLGMHRNAVGRWEQGDFLPASKTIVLEIARRLHLDESETRALLEASLTALSPHWSVPLPRNAYFTGREEVLEALHQQLGRRQAVALTQSSALSGLGGVGKTQIALEYAYRHALDYSAVFWMGAETVESIISSLLRVAEVLRLPERDDQDQQRVLAAVHHWLTTHHDWLVICDNLEDLDLPARFLPIVRQGAILLTTRCQALGTLARGIDLEPMGEEEGVLLLLRRAKLVAPDASQEDVQRLARQNARLSAAARQLVTELGRLPLAIDQAGAYIEETGCGLDEYVQHYRQKRQLLLDRRGLSSDHPLSVVATIRLACQRVVEQHPAALELLLCCAFLYAEAIPEELLLAGADHLGPVLGPVVSDATHFDLALATLRRYSLVQRQPETRTLSLHRLVQVIVQEELPEHDQEHWRQRLVHLLSAVFPDHTDERAPDLWEQCARLLPHAMTCIATIPTHLQDQELADVLCKAADYVFDRSQTELAQALYQRALQIQEQVTGPGHPKVAMLVQRLAYLYRRLDQFEQAESLLLATMSMLEQALGPEHPAVASHLSLLATVYTDRGKYELAEPLYQRALSIQEQTLGPDHPEIAESLLWLGVFCASQGKYDVAEAVYQRALSYWERVAGPGQLQVAYLLNQFGLLYTEQGKYELAEACCQRALRLVEQIKGAEHYDTANMLETLASLYCAWGRYEVAEPLYQRSLHLFEQALGPAHRTVSYPLSGLAILRRDQGRFEEAGALFQRALRIREQVVGGEHPETAQILHDVAILRQKEGNVREACSLAERALVIRSQAFGDGHPKTLSTCVLHTELVQACAQKDMQAVSRRPRHPSPRH
ncbi:MAG: FxSxx-COOH system tetratricopeptide repeat protein [Ktedonobacterales bacterium]